MNKVQYWLLNFVVISMDTLNMLLPENLDYLFYEPQGFTRTMLRDTLNELFQKGDIIARRNVKVENSSHLSEEFIPNLAEIEAGLVGESTLFYYLTIQGGHRWEAYSKPDWNLYIDIKYTSNKSAKGIITASNRALIEQYLFLQTYREPISLIKGTEIWNTLTPWHATYWKTLPVGYQVEFQFTNIKTKLNYATRKIEEGVPGLKKVPEFAKEIFNKIDNWYINWGIDQQ